VTSADVVLGVLWLGLTLYALLGGADFGAGYWDLLARGQRATARREFIAHTIGPVWEANHVWLIFVITLFWTVFPAAFAAFASTLYIPLTVAAIGVIGRGAAFAFRGIATHRRPYDVLFGLSSIVTPLFLGLCAGAVASGRVPPGIAAGDIVTSWLNPTSAYCGLLAVGFCAYLAAVYLTGDAVREGDADLTGYFWRRAVGSGVVVGVLAIGGLAMLRVDSPELFTGLRSDAWPLVVLSGLAGIASLGLLAIRRATAARVTAALAVASVLWGWGAAQYPVLLHPDLTVGVAAASPGVLSAVLAALVVSAVLLAPSLGWLLLLFQRSVSAVSVEDHGGSHDP
jgi:cytochrome bd ubiquinol oxidase subunit II